METKFQQWVYFSHPLNRQESVFNISHIICFFMSSFSHYRTLFININTSILKYATIQSGLFLSTVAKISRSRILTKIWDFWCDVGYEENLKMQMRLLQRLTGQFWYIFDQMKWYVALHFHHDWKVKMLSKQKNVVCFKDVMCSLFFLYQFFFSNYSFYKDGTFTIPEKKET